MTSAGNILLDAFQDIRQRGQLRDKPQGERSMRATVQAFNALTGNALSEVQGWQFMVLLKLARAGGGAFHQDDYQDCAAYAALAGEAAGRAEETSVSGE